MKERTELIRRIAAGLDVGVQEFLGWVEGVKKAQEKVRGTYN